MYTEIELDKPRRLRFNITAIRDLEAMMGKPIGEITRDLRMVGVTAIIACLWAGLKHEDKTLTPNLIVKILEDYLDKPDSGGTRYVLTVIGEALSASGLMKKMDDETEGNAQPEPMA